MFTKIDFEKLSTEYSQFGVVVAIKRIQRWLDFRNEILMVVITVGTIFRLYDGQFYHKFISNIGTHINLHTVEIVRQTFTYLHKILRMTHTNLAFSILFDQNSPKPTQFINNIHTYIYKPCFWVCLWNLCPGVMGKYVMLSGVVVCIMFSFRSTTT